MPDSAHSITLADKLADSSNIAVKVSLEGPNWTSGDTTAKYPSLGVMVSTLRELGDSSSSCSRISTAESEERPHGVRPRDSSELIVVDSEQEDREVPAAFANEEGFRSQYLGLLDHHLKHEIATSYKPWADRSVSVQGGCCTHHKAQLENFMKTTTFDVVQKMIWIEEGRLSGKSERPE
jgi:hypothetical protein